MSVEGRAFIIGSCLEEPKEKSLERRDDGGEVDLFVEVIIESELLQGVRQVFDMRGVDEDKRSPPSEYAP